MPGTLPTFDVALARFQQFLLDQQVARPALRWLAREDVTLDGKLLIVSELPERDRLIEQTYAHAVAMKAVGVHFQALGVDEGAVYCNLYVARTNADAEGKRLAGLKLSMRTPPLDVRIVDRATWERCTKRQQSAQHEALDDWFRS